MKKEIKQKKKIILNILMFSILILLSVDNVHALSVTPSSCINGTCDQFPVYIGFPAVNTSVTASIQFSGTWEDYYQFGVVSICSSGNIKVTSGTQCINSCFADTFTVQNTRTSCTANGHEGLISNVYFQIRKANWGSQTYDVSENLHITPLNWTEHVSIVDLYLTDNDLSTTISSDNVIIYQNGEIIDNQEQTNNKLDEQIQQDKEQHDEFMDSDISDEDKELPDDSKYQDYTSTEDSLKDKVNQADLSVVSIGIDANSSNWVWNTLTSFIQSNSIIFGMFIAILSIGIIKLALGR